MSESINGLGNLVKNISSNSRKYHPAVQVTADKLQDVSEFISNVKDNSGKVYNNLYNTVKEQKYALGAVATLGATVLYLWGRTSKNQKTIRDKDNQLAVLKGKIDFCSDHYNEDR